VGYFLPLCCGQSNYPQLPPTGRNLACAPTGPTPVLPLFRLNSPLFCLFRGSRARDPVAHSRQRRACGTRRTPEVKDDVTATPQNTGAPKELTLPALRSLGQLAEAQPIIEIDSREQTPLIFTRLQSVAGVTLSEGDYSIAGVVDFRIERKGSLDELASNCVGHNRDRFERELFRLRPYKFRRLLVIGATCERDILTHPYRSAINPRCILSSLFAWQARFDLPYVLVPTPKMAARLIETWALYHCREVVQSANGLLRSYWRSAKARIPTVDVGGEPEPPEPPEPPE